MKKGCNLCSKNIADIDFKDTDPLKRFISGMGKIRPKRKTHLCSKHQRKLARAIKKARHFGLISFTSK